MIFLFCMCMREIFVKKIKSEIEGICSFWNRIKHWFKTETILYFYAITNKTNISDWFLEAQNRLILHVADRYMYLPSFTEPAERTVVIGNAGAIR